MNETFPLTDITPALRSEVQAVREMMTALEARILALEAKTKGITVTQKDPKKGEDECQLQES